jgi:cytochrome bd-type quinol oxidase subunit 1
VIIPVQMVFGHLTGEYVLHYQPERFAAIEARWQTQQPATEVFLAIPDPWAERNAASSMCGHRTRSCRDVGDAAALGQFACQHANKATHELRTDYTIVRVVAGLYDPCKPPASRNG